MDSDAGRREVKSGSVTQTRFYSHNSHTKRSSTRASELNSPREKFFSSFNGPQLSSNTPYQTKMSELTSDRITKQPFRNIQSKIDRIRVNNGGQSALSNLSSMSAQTANNMAVRPFARTSFGQALMEEHVQHHKLNFNYGADSHLVPSNSSVERMRQQ